MKNKLLTLTAALVSTITTQAAVLIGGGTGSGMTATASATNDGNTQDFGPTQTINGSGLSSGQHSAGVRLGWMHPVSGDGPTITNSWIQWDLGESYTLDSIHVWNQNQSNQPNYLTDVDIYFSNEASPGDPEGIPAEAANWTLWTGNEVTLAAPTFLNDYTGFDLETVAALPLPTTAVRFVRFEVNDVNFDWASGGASGRYGLAEIQFTGTAIPEPSTALLGGLGLLTLLRRRRA